jgi:hypothetical protein
MEHRQVAVDCFNATWKYLDKPDRTVADDHMMLALAYTSWYHWMQIGKPVNFARGHWLLSRVNAVLGNGKEALSHAQRVLEICQAEGIGDFDLAYAYEALARSYAVLGQPDDRDRNCELAVEAGKAIAGEGDKKLFDSDLASVPRG